MRCSPGSLYRACQISRETAAVMVEVVPPCGRHVYGARVQVVGDHRDDDVAVGQRVDWHLARVTVLDRDQAFPLDAGV
jgi:hypothetical protein